MIKVENLTKKFGNCYALSNVNFEVKTGDIVAILGPNGAGKTTLIKVLANIIKPTSGKVKIAGVRLKADTDGIRRLIGIVTHQTFLYGELTAQENLDFYCRMYDVPDAQRRIYEVAERVGMREHLSEQVDTLSRGMQQRLSLARSLLHKPPILLLDEPESGLDEQIRSTVWEVLREEEGRKRTIVFTTHNLRRGLELGERTLVLNKGRIVFEGSPSSNLDKLMDTIRNSVGDK